MSDHSIYLRVSGVYVHGELLSWRLGPPPTYVGLGRFQHGPNVIPVHVTRDIEKFLKFSRPDIRRHIKLSECCMRGMSKLASKHYTPGYMKLVWIPADKSPLSTCQSPAGRCD